MRDGRRALRAERRRRGSIVGLVGMREEGIVCRRAIGEVVVVCGGGRGE